MEYYSAIKSNEVLIYVTTWMNLKNIMLSETSHSQKATYCMSPFMNSSEKATTETEDSLHGRSGLEVGRRDPTTNSLL